MLFMKKLSYAIAVSFCLAGAAAAQTSALGALSAAAGAVPAAFPAARPAPALPDAVTRALASDVLDLTPSFADYLAAYALSNGYTVLEMDGGKMTTKAKLLDYSAGALGLPGVPENWDAFIDYAGDLPSIHRTNLILVVVRDAGKIRRADAKLYADLRDVAEFTCKNAREWSKGEFSIKFAFVD